MILSINNLTLPFEDPVLKFLLVLVIILAAPLLLNKIKVPHLLGLIIAGAIIGPNGFNVLARDSSIVVTGTTGLLYIMFLAGLEIDMGDFKKNKWKSLGYGGYAFIFPFILGYIGSYYLLNFSVLTSVLFASLFSSQTLITYPLISKLGISKNRAVNITVGGTMITDVATLLVLAVVVGMIQGDVGTAFWLKLTGSFVIFGLIVLMVFPLIGRWFFKKVDDKISQYIFVLVMIYLAALLAELAGVEAIIGAFFAGLALNRLIPHTSSLMNRVEFVGNAIFIPFFLISVGMLIDFKVFFNSFETLKVAGIMLVASIGGKYISAVIAQKTFRFTKEEGILVFGLSSASAAATLATVMVGYNIIISESETGEPIRLLNEHVLNGSILLILISCTISSFISMSSAQKIAALENEDTVSGNNHEEENILLAINYENTVERMVNLGILIKAHSNTEDFFALNIINEDKNESSIKNAEKLLHQATDTAASADVKLKALKRYDNDVINGVNNVIKEHNITDLIIGLEDEKGFSTSFAHNLYNGYLQNDDVNVFVYQAAQPLSTIKRYAVMIPENAHKEAGFFHALVRVWNIARNSGATIIFYAPEDILNVLQRIIKKANIEAEFIIMNTWKDGEKTAAEIKEDEGLIIFMAKRGMLSYTPRMRMIPELLNRSLQKNNYLLIFPYSEYNQEYVERRSVGNHDDFVEIGNVIKRIFK
ncbi:Na(+)/H(+)-K(+) antiporter GerN [Chryseobacterium aquaeductus]|uniref:Na(+)/H(+)-K(+) antiporter GerN n=1 Tax=Chryseobacterium aquaeductus TaxID=2675056 RepID=A0A9N8MI65_9FLAO|nr:cation:proton antiporter [Chryseobacterium aquaeductus]CAA7331652.1 Na(+)/H(+)-K(+) antiporter GerN [Chryseobacterium potabilaquae]CAD7811491.1 Na(+)/H(+)-K(+) antiporter GerN [Chryseobacterium aquaeductus]